MAYLEVLEWLNEPTFNLLLFIQSTYELKTAYKVTVTENECHTPSHKPYVNEVTLREQNLYLTILLVY